MRLFLSRIVAFISILLVLQVLITLLLPYYYGNRRFAEKLDYFEENSDKYNVLVFGSSRMYNHLIPSLFDSLLVNENVKTFNFASPGSFNPESYFLYEEFIDRNKDNKIKLVLMELQTLHHIDEGNMKTYQGNYWNSLKVLNYSLNYISNSNYTIDKKSSLRKEYISDLLYKYLSFDKLRYWKNRLLNRPKLTYEFEGYQALDKHMIENNQKVELMKRYDAFHLDTISLAANINEAKEISFLKDSILYLNEYYLERLNYLIDKSRDKGIHLIYIIPPRMSSYTELISLYQSLPSENIIEIANYANYPELYLSENSFDIGHLNYSGACIFTEATAKKVDLILKGTSN